MRIPSPTFQPVPSTHPFPLRNQPTRFPQPAQRDEIVFAGTKRAKDEKLSEIEGPARKTSRSRQLSVTATERRPDLTELMNAARSGNMPTLNEQLYLIRYAINPSLHLNQQDLEGKTALHHAVENNQLNAVKALLKQNANKTFQDQDFHTPMTKAAQLGNVEALKLLCKSHDDLNPPQSPENRQPLHTAIQHNQFEAAVYLLHQGAKPNVLTVQPDNNTSAMTPLMIAVSQDNPELLDLLLANGATIDLEDENGHTALTHAAKRYQWNIVERLLQRKADPETAETELHKMLATACETNQIEHIRFLLKHGIRPDEAPDHNAKVLYKALQQAAKNNDLKTAELLLKGGLEADPPNSTVKVPAIIMAAAYKNPDIVKLLLKHHAYIDAQSQQLGQYNGQTALHQAVKNNDEALTDYLIDHGADLEIEDIQGRTAFTHAVEKGHNQLAKKLYEDYGTAISWNFASMETNLTPMLAAAENSNLEMLKFMIDQGVDVNQPNEYGVTPLMWAESRETAQRLIQAGADIEAQDNSNDTPLMHQSRDNNTTVMSLLLGYGARVNHSNEEQNTALVKAAEVHSLEALKLLIRRGANVNQTNIASETALTQALNYASDLDNRIDESKTVELINTLLDAGASVNQRNDNGHNALSLAVANLLPQSVETLLKRGANPAAITIDDEAFRSMLSLAVYTIQERENLTDEGAKVLEHLIRHAPEEAGRNPELMNLAQDITQKTLPDTTNQQTISNQWEENFSELRKLLQAGVPIQLTQPQSFGTLRYAAKHNQEEKLDFLLDKGLPPDGVYGSKDTALMSASRQGNTRALDVLLEAGANPNLKNSDGDTPFSLAAKAGCLNTMLRLLQGGADPAPHIDHTQTPEDAMDIDTQPTDSVPNSPLAHRAKPYPILTEDERREMSLIWPVKLADPRVKEYVESMLGINHGTTHGERKITWNLQTRNRQQQQKQADWEQTQKSLTDRINSQR